MSNYLTNKFHVLVCENEIPTQAEINAQFAPQAIRPSIESLASPDSGRADDGVMRIYWVLSRVHKLEITLRPGTTEYASSILNKVVGKTY